MLKESGFYRNRFPEIKAFVIGVPEIIYAKSYMQKGSFSNKKIKLPCCKHGKLLS